MNFVTSFGYRGNLVVKNLPIKTPNSALVDLRQAFIPADTPDGSYLEISIRIADKDLALRDLGAFLEFADRIFGRLSMNGLPSYARREHGHLKISKMQRGSWELILQELISSGYSHALLVIYLAIKYLPQGMDSIASSYNHIEQGRLARENRKRIRKEMEQDKELKTLSDSRRNQLSELVE